MDKESQKKFDELVKLDPSNLTMEDKAFLLARQSYMTQEQKRVFAVIFEPIETPKEEEPAVQVKETGVKAKKV